MRRTVVLGVVMVLLSLLPACGRREGAPTLPTTPEPPKPVDVRLRLISSQTGRPVAGARVTARRAEYRFTCVALGEVLAEAVSDADGGVVLRGIPGSSDPGPVRRDVALRIDAGPRFLVREVFLGDTPGSDPGVYPLWELAPEIGATEEMTREINGGGVAKPPGPVYVEITPEFEPVRGDFEAAARRNNEVLADPAVPIRVVSAGEVPAGAFRVRLEIASEPTFPTTVCGSGGCVIIFPRNPATGGPSVDVFVAMHELGHVMGLDHHPGEGLMSIVRPRRDWTEQEVWAVRPRRHRANDNVWPDRALGPACP
jgi:hypothetical protein